MACLHETRDRIDEALNAAFENYGRSVFFEDEEDLEITRNTVETLMHAYIELDEFLGDDEEAAEGTPEAPEKSAGIALVPKKKEATTYGQLV